VTAKVKLLQLLPLTSHRHMEKSFTCMAVLIALTLKSQPPN